MQSKAYFVPGHRTNNAGYPTAVAARWQGLVVTNSGYTGRKPKPLRGVIHPFGYYVYDLAVKLDSIYYDTKNWVTGDNLHPFTVGISFPDVPSVNNLYNRAVDELNEKTRGSLDLSVDLAEAGQTARMFRLTDQVVDFTRTFTRRFGTLKSAGSAWLQYTYGVKPLLSSIHGVVAETERLVLNKTARFRARATESIPLGRLGYYAPQGLYAYVPVKLRLKRSITLGVCIDQKDGGVDRLTSLNPVSIAWELMPYSFVVDWFLDIGGYLRNLETSLLYASRFRSGYRTDLMAVEGDFNYSTPYQPTGWNNRTYGSLKYVSMQRSVLTTYPAPRLPSFQANLGSSRLISAAALLSTLLNGNQPRFR